MDAMIEQGARWLCLGGTGAVFLLVLFGVFRKFLYIGRPNEILVFSGKNNKLADGTSIGYRAVLGGGWAWQTPFLEKVARMPLTTIPIEITTTNAYSKGGIPLNVHAVANVRVSSNPQRVKNAIERFMGRDPGEIHRVAKETLEGHLRGVLAQLTPEEVNEDRLKFAGSLTDEAEEDFTKLGLQLDVLKIQNVSDDVEYLDSIGRSQIATVIRDAEIAESDAKSQAEQAESAADEGANVAIKQSEEAIVAKKNELRELRGELSANVDAAKRRAAKAAAEARARAEIELQEIRGHVEELRLQADVVLPAAAERKAAEFRAQGDASFIESEGKAMAQVLQMMTDSWHLAGADAKDIFLIQQLETVMQTVVERVNNLSINEVTLLDGGDGEALVKHVASFPAMVRGVLEELHASTGVNVTGILSGASNKEVI
jgi:flotillin